MIIRQFAFAPVILSMVSLMGCNVSKTESAEECIERFENVGSEVMAMIKGELVPTFTYEMSANKAAINALYEHTQPMGAPHITVANGANSPALDAFYKADVPPNGAIFAGEDISLYRIKGLAGSRDETIAAGCRSAPEEARLIHIAWTPDYAEASD